MQILLVNQKHQNCHQIQKKMQMSEEIHKSFHFFISCHDERRNRGQGVRGKLRCEGFEISVETERERENFDAGKF